MRKCFEFWPGRLLLEVASALKFDNLSCIPLLAQYIAWYLIHTSIFGVLLIRMINRGPYDNYSRKKKKWPCGPRWAIFQLKMKYTWYASSACAIVPLLSGKWSHANTCRFDAIELNSHHVIWVAFSDTALITVGIWPEPCSGELLQLDGEYDGCRKGGQILHWR